MLIDGGECFSDCLPRDGDLFGELALTGLGQAVAQVRLHMRSRPAAT